MLSELEMRNVCITNEYAVYIPPLLLLPPPPPHHSLLRPPKKECTWS